ncbi:Serpentine Receptor, class D (Delta) [Caenorhabditis elegans]|uniref:Serpentine Receptor, class D (Delta) n=1 Tax=Caenorhabditis elegans TaxID=6239 RepID=Q9U399_CAEEL|nr:Serpentine Receptor, class D (Delta) [Caenorhabditis elegans]CAB54284.1 Serpentine Receptor, class D (Delta) [Caenorhabditis elegans]|eukprot:NP_510211.1 Serpentine Receptor, class D (delta) [Caenorhabditis elegans]
MISAEDYIFLSSIFYPVSSTLAVSVQFFLLYLIVKHSPKHLNFLRATLALTSVFQIILIIVTYFTQVRYQTTKTPIEIWTYGYCRFFEPWICNCFYQIMQLSVLASHLTIYGTFFLKYRMVTKLQMSQVEIMKTYVVFYFPLILSTIFVVIIFKTQVWTVQAEEELRVVNIDGNNSRMYLIFAILNYSHWPNTSNLVIYGACLLASPVICFFYRKNTLKHIKNQAGNMSIACQEQYRSFILGLTIQCILPCVIFIPLEFLYYYCIITKNELLFVEFFFPVIVELPAMIDPFISIYFVTPYRKLIIKWVRKRKTLHRTDTF